MIEHSVSMTCEICADLAPLVQDGVASADSEALLRAHLALCPSCRAKFDLPEAALLTAPAEDKILQKLRRKLSFSMLAFALGGLLFGLMLAMSQEAALMFLFFPLLCGVICWMDDFMWKLVPPLASILWIVCLFFVEAHRFTSPLAALQSTLWSAIQPFVLCLLGALCAKLLKYAFGKEPKK